MTALTDRVRSAIEHTWKPTTNTHAVYKCSGCGGVAFSPHPLPKDQCVPIAEHRSVGVSDGD